MLFNICNNVLSSTNNVQSLEKLVNSGKLLDFDFIISDKTRESRT